MKKVSIIIPAYNVEKYIHRAMESCIGQVYQNIEVIVVDDGSTDNTYGVCKNFEQIDNRIRLYRKSNGGVSSARNIGLDNATGDYCVFLDADDWLEKDAINELIQLERDNKAFAMCDRYWVTMNDKNCISIISPSKGQDKAFVDREEALLCVGNGKYNLQSACYKLYEMNVIRNNGLRFNERIHYGEDGLFVFSYIKCIDKLVFDPRPLWNILDRKDSATKISFNEKMLSTGDSVKKMIEFSGNSDKLQKLLKIYLMQRIETVLQCAIETDYKKYRAYVGDLRKELQDNYSIELWSEMTLRNKYEFKKYVYLPINIIRITNCIEGKIRTIIKWIYYNTIKKVR